MTTVEVVNAFMAYVVPIIFLAVPAVLLGVFCRMGKWGFVLGLCIGAGAGYLCVPLMMPVWVVYAAVMATVAVLLFSWRA